MKHVLLLETIDDEANALLKKSCNVIETFPETDVIKYVQNHSVHGIITRGKGQVNRDLMNACPDLVVVARCGVGLDNIDVAEATKRNVKVINAPGSNSDTIAEHTLTLMLMSIRNMWTSAERVKAGDWSWRNQYSGDELRGKTLGILGMGNIGRRVARLAALFGMNVIYWDKFSVASEYTSMAMNDVLRRADIVSIHVPLMNDTVHLIGKKELKLMQPQSILINAARGAIIDEEALVEALNNDIIAGFAADVLAKEPPPAGHPLTSHKKTLITPHTGSLTKTTYREMCMYTVENVIAVLSNKNPDPESLYNRKGLKANPSRQTE